MHRLRRRLDHGAQAATGPVRAVWIAAQDDYGEDGRLLRLDPATMAVTGSLPAPAASTDVDVDSAGTLWTGSFSGVFRITQDGRLSRVRTLGRWPSVAVNRFAAWTVDHAARGTRQGPVITPRLQRVDLRTGAWVGRPLILGTLLRSGARNRIRIRGGSAWIAGPGLGEITRVYLPAR